MELGHYLEDGGAAKVNVIAVNWMEDRFGLSPDRMERMIALIHPSARVIAGDAATGRDFGGVFNVPALFIFDGKGRLVYRDGGTAGPGGKARVRRETIAGIIDGLR